jgi:hypothetical protein
MKGVKAILTVMFFIIVSVTGRTFVFADSASTYQEYLSRYNSYRTSYTEFQTAKNEYLKFRSLASQTSAVDKTRTYLRERNTLVFSYLTFLGDRIRENPGMQEQEKQTYLAKISEFQNLLTAETGRVASVSSLDEAVSLSKPFETRYIPLYLFSKQTTLALSLGNITTLGNAVQSAITSANTIAREQSSYITTDQQMIMKQWMDQITAKQDMFRQQYTAVHNSLGLLQETNTATIDRKFQELSSGIQNLKQLLTDTIAYLDELRNTLKYTN